MKSFGQYFKYHFRSTFLRFLIMTVISFTISLLFFETIIYVNNPPNSEFFFSNVSLGIYTFIFAILCVIVPIFELSGFKHRRNLDTIFSLPVSRTKMLLAHVLNGWIQITTIFTMEVCVIFTALSTEKDHVNESYLFGYYGALLLFGLIVYLFSLCIFFQANTIADGIIFMGCWNLVFVWIILFLSWSDLINYEVLFGEIELISPTLVFNVFGNITESFMMLIEGIKPYYVDELNELVLKVNMSFALWSIIGVVSAVILYFTFKNKRVEKVEDISDSPLGYRFLTPFFVLTSICMTSNFVLGVLLLIIMLISYIIYRRSVRLKKSDLIMLGVGVLVSLIAG